MLVTSLRTTAGEGWSASAIPRERRATALIIGYRRRAIQIAVVRTSLASALTGRGFLAQTNPPDNERIRQDQALMAAVAAGDAIAFAALVKDHAPRLLRLTRSMLRTSPAEAEEIVQEALLRLWRQSTKWQPNGQVSTWLHQVAYRLAVDALRRQRPSVAIETVAADLDDEDAAAPDVRLMQIEEIAAVRAAVDKLPDRQRDALILCHFQELSQAEAAAVMGIGEAAYESLLARGRRRLRALLSADG
jgi:RNA polymerase sigma-70 factor (ECF subfamily)